MKPFCAPSFEMHARSIRRFLIGTAVAVASLVGAVWAWAIAGPSWYMDPEYAMWSAKRQMAAECRLGETTILGDSRPMAALIPDVMGGDVVNLALGGGGPIEVATLLNEILKCPSLPRRVIISFSPYMLVRADWYWSRAVFFGFLGLESMEQVRRISQHSRDRILYGGELFGIIDVMRNLGYHIHFPAYYFAAMLQSGFIGRKEQNAREYRDILQSRGHRLFGRASETNWPSHDASVDDFRSTPVLNHYVEQIVAGLNDRNVPALFISMPINTATEAAMPKDLPTKLARYLSELRSRYPNVSIVGDILPVLPGKYFGDPQHLNESGAMRWSRYLPLLLSGQHANHHSFLDN